MGNAPSGNVPVVKTSWNKGTTTYVPVPNSKSLDIFSKTQKFNERNNWNSKKIVFPSLGTVSRHNARRAHTDETSGVGNAGNVPPLTTTLNELPVFLGLQIEALVLACIRRAWDVVSDVVNAAFRSA